MEEFYYDINEDYRFTEELWDISDYGSESECCESNENKKQIQFCIQKRLTKEIADNLNKCLEPLGVIVLINSTHSCMCFRGIKSSNAKTDTLYSTGAFKEKFNLDKFFNMINK